MYPRYSSYAVVCAVLLLGGCGGPKEGPPPTAAARLNAEGIRLLERGDEAGAEEMLKNALREGELVDDLVGQAESWNNLGALAMARGRAHEAWTEHATALRLYQSLPARALGEVRTRANLGAALLASGEVAEAKRQFDEAVSLAAQLKQPESARTAKVGLAAVALREGNAPRAAELARTVTGQTRDGTRDGESSAWLAGALAVEGAANETMGNRVAAEAAYAHALQIDRDRAAPRAVIDDLAALARLAEASGSGREAVSYLERRSRVLRRLGDLEGAAGDLEHAIALSRGSSRDASAPLEAELAALRSVKR